MANAIDAAHRILYCSRIADITTEKFDGPGGLAQLAGRTPRIVIQHADAVTVLNQAPYQSASNESRPAGHQISLQGHSRFTRKRIDPNYSSIENERYETAKSLKASRPCASLRFVSNRCRKGQRSGADAYQRPFGPRHTAQIPPPPDEPTQILPSPGSEAKRGLAAVQAIDRYDGDFAKFPSGKLRLHRHFKSDSPPDWSGLKMQRGE